MHLRAEERIPCQTAMAVIATPMTHSLVAVLLSRKAQDATAAARGTPTDIICDQFASTLFLSTHAALSASSLAC